MLLAVAAAPTGRVVGVEVRGIGRAGALEYRMLRSVCASIELLTPRLARRMEELGGDPPLTIEAPADGWIVLDAEEPHAVGAWLAPGAASGGAWTLQVLPTFLALGRRPADLLRDHLANEAYQLPRAPEIESRPVGDHESAYVRYAEGDLTNIAQVIDLGEGRAAMIVGAAEETEASELVDAAEHAAAWVRLGPGRWPYASEAAAQRGEKRLTQWLGSELAGWLPTEPAGDFFVVEGAGQRVGELQSVREAARRVSPSHRGGAVTRRHRPGERRLWFELDSRWAFDVGSRAFQVEERWTDHSGHAPLVASVIQRCTASGEPVQMEVRVADRSRRGTLQPTPHYVPDPLIDPFLSRFAQEGGDDPILVEYSTASPDGLCVAMLQRVEPQPGARDSAAAAVVLEVRDFRPWPVQYEFDAGGQLLEVRHIPGLRMVRSADRAADDGGGLLRSLRQWLHAGGRS